MGETYGVLPTDVMRRAPGEFWLNAQIRAATAQFKNDKQREAQRRQGSAGVASPAEKRDLADAQESRADRREEMESEGRKTTSTTDQLDALEDFQADVERERQLKQSLGGDAAGVADDGMEGR